MWKLLIALFIKKQTVRLGDKVETELDQISLLFTVMLVC